MFLEVNNLSVYRETCNLAQGLKGRLKLSNCKLWLKVILGKATACFIRFHYCLPLISCDTVEYPPGNQTSSSSSDWFIFSSFVLYIFSSSSSICFLSSSLPNFHRTVYQQNWSNNLSFQLKVNSRPFSSSSSSSFSSTFHLQETKNSSFIWPFHFTLLSIQ